MLWIFTAQGMSLFWGLLRALFSLTEARRVDCGQEKRPDRGIVTWENVEIGYSR